MHTEARQAASDVYKRQNNNCGPSGIELGLVATSRVLPMQKLRLVIVINHFCIALYSAL